MIQSVRLLPAAWEGLLKIRQHAAETLGEQAAERAADAILDSLERFLSLPDSGSLTPDPWLNSLGYGMVISGRRNVSVYKRIDSTVYVYLIADTGTDYTRIFRDTIVHDPRLLSQEKDPGEDDSTFRRGMEMYCEKCSRVVDGDRCPVCKSRRVREPGAKDPCYLTEQDYISSGILEDMLKQGNIPYLKKDVMGAGMAIKVGPMLERSRFYVPYEQLGNARAVLEELFPPAEASGSPDQTVPCE